MQQRIVSLTLVSILMLALASCTTQSEVIPSQMIEESTSIPTVSNPVDYVDVQRNPEKYDGEFIRVAGQITNFSSTNDFAFYFNDRLSQYEDGIGFMIEINHFQNDLDIDEVYAIGDYVVVEGVWRVRTIQESLEEATVIQTGKDAEEAAKVYLTFWENERQDFASSSPILNYMEIFNDKNYDGQYVRIVGQIFAAKTNGVTNHRNIRFRSPVTNEAIIEFSLKGCPLAMQDICVEGEYAVISGKIDTNNYFASMSDCYVECVGQEAEKIYTAMTAGHH